MTDEKNNFQIESDRHEHFMRLYVPVQRRLYGYIASITGSWSDIDDVVQETVSVMWTKFDDFKPGTDFVAWARAIAYYRVLELRRKNKRKERQFNENAIKAINSMAVSSQLPDDRRLDALEKCMGKLEKNERHLLRLRYESGATIASVAKRIDQSVNTLYKTFQRVHVALFNCVRRTIAKEERI